MPSSRAASRAHVSAGPSSGSAPAAVSSGLASTGHFSGRTTRSAPAAAAARVSRSAASRLRSRSAVELSCTAAALTAIAPLSPWIDPSVNPFRRGYRASMRTSPVGPWRGEAGAQSGRPGTVPLPPARMPLVRGGRPLKRWRWVGAFSADAMLCAARAFIGGVPVTWWAIWDGERLHERTQRRPGAVRMEPGRVRASPLDLSFEEGPGVEVVSPHGAQYIWTRKQAGMPMRGTRARPAVRGLRLHRRHGRLPRAPHRLALVGRGRDRRVRRARRVEPRRRRARRAGALGAHRLGRRHAAPRRAVGVRRRPLGGRRPALRGRSGPRPPRADARLRLRLRAAVRPLQRLAAATQGTFARVGVY